MSQRNLLHRVVPYRHHVAKLAVSTALVALLVGCGKDDNPVSPNPAPFVPLEAVAVVQGPVTYNGHSYYRLANSDWTTAEENAVRMLGGHVVTVDDAAENNFIKTTFADAAGSGRVWIGLNDAVTEGTFVYVSGQAYTYTNWDTNEPNNAGDEDYVAMYSGNGFWVDVKDLSSPGIGLVYGVVEADVNAAVYVVQGPETYDGHTYYRLNNTNWSDAESFAVNVLGGHLATVDDAAENNFIKTTFADAPGSGRVWIGLNDATTEGTFVYASGQAYTYTNWDTNEPNNAGNEDYVAMYSGNGFWVDVRDLPDPGVGLVYGVVEVE